MSRRPHPTLEKVEITDVAAEGNAIAKVDGKVLFVPYVAPGDVVDVRVTRRKSSFMQGLATRLHTAGPHRVEPVCSHFGLCGGCKWQHLDYQEQLHYKRKQVVDSLERIAKVPFPEVLPIVASEQTLRYRNKLEYTFTDRRWLDPGEPFDQPADKLCGLGFHIPGKFDKVLDLRQCHLQPELSDQIRDEARRFCIDNQIPFHNLRTHKGLMRNLIVRNSNQGEWMVILVVADPDPAPREALLEHLRARFPQITSLYYVLNDKMNDSIGDLQPVLHHGQPFLTEAMLGLRFRVGPKAFYQTNARQAEKLYQVALDFAQLDGTQVAYDLYTGTGTIANALAMKAKWVYGIEYVAEAIEDARENSRVNGIGNTTFFAGDMKDILTPAFVAAHGRPDVIVTDPPRAGMHPDVAATIVQAAPSRVVYVSCNPATQARDIALMHPAYRVARVQPVDMFPHTHHVENVVLLERADS